MLLTHFKQIVDKAKPKILNENLTDAYNLLALDRSKGMSSSTVTKELYSRIRTVLQNDQTNKGSSLSKSSVLKLQSEFVYRHVLYNDEVLSYLEVLQILSDSCRQNFRYFPPFSDEEKWTEALAYCKDYKKFSPSSFGLVFGDMRSQYPKEFDRAMSAKELITRGCKVTIEDSNLTIVEGEDKVLNEIEDRIEMLGGMSVIQNLFNLLARSGKYSLKLQRYLITREASGVSFDQKPQIPFGLLLNLSLKHPRDGRRTKKPLKIFQEILHLSTILVNTQYGVQHYNMWEYHFHDGYTIIGFLREVALWDSLFTVPQAKMDVTSKIFSKLFAFIPDSEFERILGFSRVDFMSFFSILNQATKESPHQFYVLYISSLKKFLPRLSEQNIKAILNFLSHQGGVNKDFNRPHEYLAVDFHQKPLLKLGESKFIFPNRSWSAPNFYEAFVTHFRDYNQGIVKDIDNRLGIELEDFIKTEFARKNISFVCGNYKVGKISGECDFLIESNTAIILIEIKKKSLTRLAKTGNDVKIFLDLAETILAAHLQTGRTEICIRQEGSISLKSGAHSHSVDHNGRTFERFALTQLDFGAFHDRTIIRQFLTALLTHSFSINEQQLRAGGDPGIKPEETDQIIERFKGLEKKRLDWIRQFEQLSSLDSSFAAHPFFSCWFISLQQLLEITEMATDNNSFHSIIMRSKHVTFNTLDWYREFDIAHSQLSV